MTIMGPIHNVDCLTSHNLLHTYANSSCEHTTNSAFVDTHPGIYRQLLQLLLPTYTLYQRPNSI